MPRAEIDDQRAFRLGRWKAPSDLGELVRAVFETADHRSLIGWPDVVAWLEVRDRIGPLHRDAGLGERREIVGVIDVVFRNRCT